MSYRLAPTGLGSAIDSLPTPAQLGRIRSKNGRSYQITPDDLLWLARSVTYEGGNRAATAWTYAQRLMSFNSPSLLRLVQGHSQPVNPIWRRDGEKCRPGGPYHGRPECSEQKLTKRDTASTMSWSSVPAPVRDLLVKWAQAGVENPVPRATDFADAAVSQGFLNRNSDAGIVMRDGNWYLYEGRSAGWPADQVVIEYEGRVAGPSFFAGIPSWLPWALGGGAAAALVTGGVIIAVSHRKATRR